MEMKKEKFMDLSEEARLMTNGGSTCLKTGLTPIPTKKLSTTGPQSNLTSGGVIIRESKQSS
jgi:hypothetical protein